MVGAYAVNLAAKGGETRLQQKNADVKPVQMQPVEPEATKDPQEAMVAASPNTVRLLDFARSASF